MFGKTIQLTRPRKCIADRDSRGINEGRQAARDVDTYLMGIGTQLPKTGGIVQRAPYEIIGRPDKMEKQANGVLSAA